MKKIYILGHGIMSFTLTFTTTIKHDFYTYVLEGTMLDGRCSAKVVDGHAYEGSDAENGHASINETIKTHWVLSDSMAMYQDLKQCAKMISAKPIPPAKKIVLAEHGGTLLILDADTYIYITEKNTLTSLDTIQSRIDEKLLNQEYELHWLACRSYIAAELTTTAGILAYAKENMLGAEDVETIL